MRHCRFAVLVTATAVLGACASAPPSDAGSQVASARSILVTSTPAAGSTVNGPVDQLLLRFSPPARLLEVTVSGGGMTMPVMVTAVGEVAQYSVPISELEAGSYTVDWRASVGGTEHRGTIPFTVR